MQNISNALPPKLKSDEEVAAANSELNKVLIRNLVIFVGVKAAIYYGMYRWAKSVRETN